ncbi:uncharacterized protein LOC123874036 [Maniola jurtina]|uniref:uncharacterized protein LOC123874036 n=1 Tax=Maniola jurtina TaxID=191418 RepID=UPI001E68D97B|nr:uncharacterized protein LOC123874036 [Maniola jurtina]
MKAVLCLVLGLAALAAARPDVDTTLLGKVDTMDIKEKQFFILKLLNNIMGPVMYKEIEDIGKNFKIEDNVELYTKQVVVKTFLENWKFGFLPRGEVFTLHVDRQLKEVITMFHMLYYAKDFATFIKTACWMRLYLNEGMFVYALTVAVRHRDDCKGIILPPPYEIYPYFFVRADVIQKAYLLKMKRGLLDTHLTDFYGIKKTDKDIYIIDENVYDRRVWLNDEDKLRYFTEDIGLNTYYYYFHVDYPFWMKNDVTNKFMIRRWELTFYTYQQILARYYLERLSNGLGEIDYLSWHKPIRKGYWPWMILHNGVQLPVRFNNQVFVSDKDIAVAKLVADYERIISEAIIKGYIEINGVRIDLTKSADIEALGKLVYGTIEKTDMTKLQVDAYRYLLIMMKAVVGLNTWNSDKYFVVPSVLDHYQTALRDPVFYQLQKRIVYFMRLFKNRLPSYTREDVYFPGVKIDNVVVDKLVTYFDDYFMDMTNAVTYTDDELKKTTSDMIFYVRKRRLNHQPFKVTLDILSDKTVDSVVRVFLGPKEDHMGRLIDINQNRWNFVELDSFLYKLTAGKNTIVRNSIDMHNLVRDRTMTRDLWKKIDGITDMRDLLRKDLRNYHTGFPTRLLLPKGRIGGMRMMLYVIITPLRMVDNVDTSILDINRKDLFVDFRSTVLLDKMPLGFPLDRHIDTSKFFTPNMRFVDVIIFHKPQVSDMWTRWNRYVLKSYDLLDKTPVVNDSYFTDVDVNTKVDRDVNIFDVSVRSGMLSINLAENEQGVTVRIELWAMKTVLCVVLGLAAMAAAHAVYDDHTFVNMDVKQRQIWILKLLNHVTEPVVYKDIEDIGKNFKIEENVELYTKQEVVKVFLNNWKFGFLPRGEVFTLNIDRQLKEVITMFHMLYYAKDFTTFMKTACWMRLYLNEGMFVYALTVAVRHREDCKGIILPPPYEIYPYYFVRSDVIQKAYLLKMKKGLIDHKLCDLYGIKKTEKDVYIIDENVYDRRHYLNDEDRLRYFTEDIDLSTYYYYFHVDYPFWMKDDMTPKFMHRRWELTLYVYQQILARYYLERLSNGLGDITTFSVLKPIRKGYWPWMMLHNGVQLPVRLNNYMFNEDKNTAVMKVAVEYERIIHEAVVKGYIEINGLRLELTKTEDIEMLGKLIYGTVDKINVNRPKWEAYRYMLILMKAFVGLNYFNNDKYFVMPSVLDSYQTALRDPVFYQLQKRFYNIVKLFKMRLPSYTHEDLFFPGVKIDNVVVDKLVTYFDDYFMDMTNAVTLNSDEFKKSRSDMIFYVRKRRLNHQPFKVVFDVQSDKAVDSVVRIFLGPKVDCLGRLIDLNQNRVNFVELDSFLYKLNTGKNTITRNSYDMHNLVRDRIMTRDLWKKIDTITDVKDLLIKDLRNYHTGFPTRLLLPKGHVGGMKMMLYIIVTPLRLVDGVDTGILDTNRKDLFVDFRSTVLLDKMPLGFPFDRHIDLTKFFTPNMKFLDVFIYHKKQICDMKARWNRYVLKNYDMVDRTTFIDNYDVDVDFDTMVGEKVKDFY